MPKFFAPRQTIKGFVDFSSYFTPFQTSHSAKLASLVAVVSVRSTEQASHNAELACRIAESSRLGCKIVVLSLRRLSWDKARLARLFLFLRLSEFFQWSI